MKPIGSAPVYDEHEEGGLICMIMMQYVFIHICIDNDYIYVCIYICVYIYMCIYIYVCVCARVCVR